MEFIIQHQLNIMLSIGNVCGAVALSTLIAGIREKRRKILFALVLSAAILLISDRYIWLFEGDLSTKGWWMTRLNAFLCHGSTVVVFYTINLYLKELFAEHKDLDPNLKRFRFNSILLIAMEVLIFIFQFTDFNYYFDAANTYQQGRFYPLFTMGPFIALMVQISLIVQYYKKLEKNIRVFLLIFAIIPFLDPFVQLVLPDVDTTDIAFSLMALMIYSVDMVNTHKAAENSMRAVAVSNAKSAFLSNMSHEIRTPLNTVLGMNEMVLRECEDPQIISYSENIHSAGTTLLGLINDILDFSKIEAGKLDIIPVDYELSTVINDLVNMIRPRAEKKGLELILDIDEQTPNLLNGDEIRIKQVITNILTNAVKYTEKGSVTFRIGFERTDDPEQIDLLVSVQDTGIGMKEEDLEKLFVQFQRIDEERNRNIEGTGLGMSITKSLLGMMGSSIEVKSKFGVGSVFSFRLRQIALMMDPIGDYAAAIQKQLQKREKFAEKLYAPDARILIVDDNPMNLEVFKNLTKKTQIQIDTADCGEHCLEKTRTEKYDLILLDHLMPRMDGIETLKQMRSRSDDKNLETPVICLTANAVSGARTQYIAAGFDDYLTKPIEYERLEEMLVRYLPQDKVRFGQPEEEAVEEPTESVDHADSTEDADSAAEAPAGLAVLSQNGIDVTAGIENCGSEEGYVSVIEMLNEALEERASELESLFTSGDLVNYTVKVHGIKSSLRIVGAKDLGEAAQALENAGKAGDTAYIEANQKQFTDDLMSLKKLLSSIS